MPICQLVHLFNSSVDLFAFFIPHSTQAPTDTVSNLDKASENTNKAIRDRRKHVRLIGCTLN